MGRIDHEWCISCQSKLATRYVRRIPPAIYRQRAGVVQFKCICGGLLNIEKTIVELFHPCSHCEGYSDELSCSDCISIYEAMVYNSDDYWKGVRDICGGVLEVGEVAEGRIRSIRIWRSGLSVDELV